MDWDEQDVSEGKNAGFMAHTVLQKQQTEWVGGGLKRVPQSHRGRHVVLDSDLVDADHFVDADLEATNVGVAVHASVTVHIIDASARGRGQRVRRRSRDHHVWQKWRSRTTVMNVDTSINSICMLWEWRDWRKKAFQL